MSDSTKFVRTSITLPEPVFKGGQSRAKQKLRNFSSYVAELIQADSKDLEQSAAQKAPTGSH